MPLIRAIDRFLLITIVSICAPLLGFSQTTPRPLPDLAKLVRQTATPTPQVGTISRVVIDLAEALSRARVGGQQYLSTTLDATIAREDRIQAKAALLPTINLNNQYEFTQSDHQGNPVFVSSDGIHVYTSQGAVHGEVVSVTQRLEYRRALAAEAVARAKQDVALRGLSTSVILNYYTLVSAQRRLVNAQQSLDEATSFLDITQRLEVGGEVAKADVIKARIILEQRRREVLEAGLTIDKAHIALAVFIFPNFNEDFTVADDLESIAPLGVFEEIQRTAITVSPDIRAAETTVNQEGIGLSIARSGFLPSLSLDYIYGINANQFAVNSGDRRNLGYAVLGTLNIPVWNWGAQRSRVKQAELRRQQAQLELALTRKEFASNLNTLYREAVVARTQTDSLHTSLDLAVESLRLVLLRYQAGEVSVLEVSDAQATLADSRNAYDEGLARYRSAWASLQVLIGNF